MPHEQLVKQGKQFRFLVSGTFAPSDPGTDYTVGTPTDVTLTLAGVGSGAGRQSTKVDLGAKRAAQYSVFVAVDYSGQVPAAQGAINCYWAPSASGTPGTGNIAGNSGVDAVAPGGALGGITLDEFILQCQEAGALETHDGAVVQVGYAGTFSPKERHGQMIVVNNGGAAFAGSNVEMCVFMNEIIGEIQDAA